MRTVDQIDRVHQRIDRREYNIVPAPACIEDMPVFVLDCDEGLGFVRRGRQRSRLGLSAAQIRALGYDDLAMHRREWLGLEPPSYFEEYFGLAR